MTMAEAVAVSAVVLVLAIVGFVLLTSYNAIVALRQRINKGRLHPVHPGVYAVGRPELTQHGRWMAAILAKGPAAGLSHRSAASLYGIALQKGNAIHVSVPAHARRRSSRGITVHRRNELTATTTQ